jgi:hypothetical protein
MVGKPLSIRIETVGALEQTVVLDIITPSVAPFIVTFKLGRPISALTKYHIMLFFVEVLHGSIRLNTVSVIGQYSGSVNFAGFFVDPPSQQTIQLINLTLVHPDGIFENSPMNGFITRWDDHRALVSVQTGNPQELDLTTMGIQGRPLEPTSF